MSDKPMWKEKGFWAPFIAIGIGFLIGITITILN